jgi:hypothetical protein
VGSTVLRDTIAAGIESKDFFGYAAGKEADRYTGLIFGKTGTVYIDENSLIVHKDAAQKQIDAEAKPEEPGVEEEGEGFGGDDTGTGGIGDNTGAGGDGRGGTIGDPGPKKEVFRRFHGAAKLDANNASLQFSDINQEIIQHFSSKYGTKVTITLEIEAVSDSGFDDSIRRTVQENSRTLGLSHAEFEED